MLKALLCFFRNFIPKPDFETRASDAQNELALRKMKIRAMIEGRML